MEKNVTAFQQKRMDEILNQRTQLGMNYGLKKDYMEEIFGAIHAESVKKQTEFFKSQKS